MAWSGLGVNYKSSQTNWATDAAYFKSIGLTGIRPSMAQLPNNWTPPGNTTAGAYEFWREAASYFSSQGFWVSWGPSHQGATSMAAPTGAVGQVPQINRPRRSLAVMLEFRCSHKKSVSRHQVENYFTLQITRGIT